MAGRDRIYTVFSRRFIGPLKVLCAPAHVSICQRLFRTARLALEQAIVGKPKSPHTRMTTRAYCADRSYGARLVRGQTVGPCCRFASSATAYTFQSAWCADRPLGLGVSGMTFELFKLVSIRLVRGQAVGPSS
jgi:hypothetical protein